MILKEIFYVNKYGIKVGGNRIHAIKFADDQALLAESSKELAELLINYIPI